MSLTIEIDWPTERGGDMDDVASFRISANQRLLTQFLDYRAERSRDYFRASAIRLALWVADHWWSLRWESLGDSRLASVDWRLRHELSSGAGDEIWPPLTIYGLGPRVLIIPGLDKAPTEVGLRYLETIPVSVAGDEYEQAVDHLFEAVLGNCARHPDAKALETLVGQLERERADVELAAWRRLEACLGFNPDGAPDKVIETMFSYEKELGEESIDEAALASPGRNAPQVLHAVLEAARSALEVDFSSLEGLQIADPHGLTPWQAAEDAANQLRHVLGLPDVLGGEVLADLLKTRWSDLKQATATARNLPYAAKRLDGPKGRLALQMVPQVDRRFELARMIGDQFWTQGQGLGVISRARTDRQKYQRAFAQALLCPISLLRRFVNLDAPTRPEISHAAKRFEVREQVIVTILVNRGYLPRETITDHLEAA